MQETFLSLVMSGLKNEFLTLTNMWAATKPEKEKRENLEENKKKDDRNVHEIKKEFVVWLH